MGLTPRQRKCVVRVGRVTVAPEPLAILRYSRSLVPGMDVATIKTDVHGNIDMNDLKRNAEKVCMNVHFHFSCM